VLPGVLRVARRDLGAVAMAAARPADAAGDPFAVLVRAAEDAGIRLETLRVRA
jgi:hypothetical protein